MKLNLFHKQKAYRMGIQTKMFKGELVPKENDVDIELAFMLTEKERQLVRNTCIFKGVSNYSLNPKSVNMSQLMGFFDDTSREWTDGVLTNAIRQASQDETGK